MVKVTAKQIGELIGRSPKYVYQLLHRKKISLKDIDFHKLVDLVMEYRIKQANAKPKGGEIE